MTVVTEIVFRLPSKQVQYGYVEVKTTTEELGLGGDVDPYAVGIAYANSVARFWEGETEGTRLITGGRKSGLIETPGKPVKGVSGASQVKPSAAQAKRVVKEWEAPPGDPKAAAARLAAGKEPRTVAEGNEMVKQVIENELDATVVSEDDSAYVQLLKQELGATVVGEDDIALAAASGFHDVEAAALSEKPWENQVESKPKPWENGGAAPVVATIDW